MTNARQEFLELLESSHRAMLGELDCARFEIKTLEDNELNEAAAIHTLKRGYSKQDLESFLSEINKNYSLGGWLGVFGFVWFKDGSFAERRFNETYDDQYWVIVSTPKVPQECL